jgi:8-oxo-dGTP pyrophosphatase MutT (NUDIX family)
MYLKIYFGNKPVFLCNERDKEIDEILHHPEAVFIDEFDKHAVNSLLHEIKKPDFHSGVILHANLDELKKAFWKDFTIIKAAGRLVKNEKGEYLFIFRRGSWDLPKGKLDKGETLEQCAIREMQEETGLVDITLKEALCTTYHTYDEFGKHILKESYWYHMEADSNGTLIPQTEEDITEIVWMNAGSIKKILPLAYPSIREVIHKAGII